ncbi:hypothetical protein O9992_29470 [Vibrio lentus]|nr:hypothetical protein [Vibrio lentus]
MVSQKVPISAKPGFRLSGFPKVFDDPATVRLPASMQKGLEGKYSDLERYYNKEVRVLTGPSEIR